MYIYIVNTQFRSLIQNLHKTKPKHKYQITAAGLLFFCILSNYMNTVHEFLQ